MTEFEFVSELPGTEGDGAVARGKVLKRFAAALKESPGQWAKYPLDLAAGSLASRASEIRCGRANSFRAGRFEAAARDGVLYVRAVES